VISNPRDDRLGCNNAPSRADYPLRELIDRGNFDGIDCRFVPHALPYRSINAGLVAIISADKPVVNWPFLFVEAAQIKKKSVGICAVFDRNLEVEQ